MKVSVLSYSFRGLLAEGKMDVFGYLEACRYRYGLGAADIWNGFLMNTEDEYLRKVRDALDERELTLADLCVDKAHVWDELKACYHSPKFREEPFVSAGVKMLDGVKIFCDGLGQSSRHPKARVA